MKMFILGGLGASLPCQHAHGGLGRKRVCAPVRLIIHGTTVRGFSIPIRDPPMHLRSLLTIIIAGSCINFHANAATAEECLTTLRAGMFAQTLEEVCSFEGGLYEGVKASYTNAGCRSIVAQADVEKTQGEVLKAVRADYVKQGEKQFCSVNKKWYVSALNPPKATKEAPPVQKNVEHVLSLAIFDDNLQPTNTYSSKIECEENGKKAASKFRASFEEQSATSAAKRVRYKCEPLLK